MAAITTEEKLAQYRDERNEALARLALNGKVQIEGVVAMLAAASAPELALQDDPGAQDAPIDAVWDDLFLVYGEMWRQVIAANLAIVNIRRAKRKGLMLV